MEFYIFIKNNFIFFKCSTIHINDFTFIFIFLSGEVKVFKKNGINVKYSRKTKNIPQIYLDHYTYTFVVDRIYLEH